MQTNVHPSNIGSVNGPAAFRLLPGLPVLPARPGPPADLAFMAHAGRQNAPWISARPFPNEARQIVEYDIPVARLQSDCGLGWSEPSAKADSYTILVDLDGCADHAAMRDNRPCLVSARCAGEIALYDRRHQWSFDHHDAHRCVVFHVPYRTFEKIAGNFDLRWSAETPGLLNGGMADETMRRLALAIWPIFDNPHGGSKSLAGHLAASAVFHVAARYGLPARAVQRSERLAPRREFRIKELIRTRLHERLTLADLAAAAGLSRSHFARAFAGSVGCSPHQWLLRQRIDHAKHLASTTDQALSEIALACGFADQSHMTRVFSRMEKISPAAWKRSFVPVQVMRRTA